MPQCLRFVVFVLLAGLMASAVQAAGPVPKPRSPLSLSISPASEPVTGRSMEFRVTVVSQVDSNSARVNVSLPEGSVLNSGALQWRGSLRGGVAKTLVFDATVPEVSHQPVIAMAAIGSEGQSQFSARALYVTQPSSQNPIAVTVTDKPRVVIRDGRRVDEYVLQ